MLTDHPAGNFEFIDTGLLSLGCRAHTGFEIVHVTFHPLPSLEQGYDLVESYLKRQGRPMQALCGMELRMPAPQHSSDFSVFNAAYADKLRSWGLYLGNCLPTTRTNVAPEVQPPTVPSLFGFYYTRPSDVGRSTYVLSGVADIKRGSDGTNIVAHGNLSPQGMGQKAWYVLQTLEGRMDELGMTWADATSTGVYTVQNIQYLMGSVIMPRLMGSAHRGLQWHFSRPPTHELEFEMDTRCILTEEIIEL